MKDKNNLVSCSSPTLKNVAKNSAGILEHSVGARNRVGIVLSYRPASDGIFKLLRSPGINFKESILLVYVCSLAGRYDNPIPIRFLAPIDSSKIPSLATLAGEIDSFVSIPGFLKSLKMPSQKRCLCFSAVFLFW